MQFGGYLQTRKRALTKPQPYWNPDLGLPTSKTDSEFLLLKQPSLCVMAAQAD